MKLNPAVSLICAIFFSLIVSFSQVELLFVVPVVFLIFLNYRVVLNIIRKLLLLNFFIVVLAIFLYFETNSYEAINLFLKVNLIILFNLLLFFSSNGFDIVKGFKILRFPKKFVSTLYFTVRLIFELNIELKNIRNSLKARNFKPKIDIFTYKTYGNIFGILFIKTVSKSNSLKESFILRGFKDEIFLNCEASLKVTDLILLSFFISLFFIKVSL